MIFNKLTAKDFDILRESGIINEIGYKSYLFNELANGNSLDITNGDIEIRLGSENLYLDVRGYLNDGDKQYQEYKISFYTKENHKGLKKLMIELINEL